jgi:hypothetical protein
MVHFKLPPTGSKNETTVDVAIAVSEAVTGLLGR